MNRREFLNFLGKGALMTSFSPMILRGVTNIKDKPILNSTIFPSTFDDVVLAPDLQYEILISWGEKISSKDRFGFNNDYIGFIKGKNKSEGYLWVNHEYVHPLFFSSKPADKKTLSDIKKEQALKHPNWEMGSKITIDSASLMNKGLEVIEAKWLFDLELKQIEVVVHPQSIVHSAVQFLDGSIKAQLGLPDMKIPIQYALGFPNRLQNNFD